MAKPSTKDDMRPEVFRLARGIDLYRDWRIQIHRAAFGTDPDLNQIVEPGLSFVDIFDQTPDARGAKYILRDLQTWYSVTAGELRWHMRQGNPEVIADIRNFLDTFRSQLGFDLFAESGLLKKIAKQVLKRGHLTSEEEWYLLKELLDDTDQTILPEAEMADVARLMADFEAAQ
jgi:hypothetical protein